MSCVRLSTSSLLWYILFMPLGRARHEVRLRDSRVSQAFNSLVSDLRLTPVPERLSFLEEYKC